MREFGIAETLKYYIKSAMDQGKVILAPYSTTLCDEWCKLFPDLPWETSYVYTTHRSLADEKAGIGTSQNGSMHIDRLRHYCKGLARKPREEGETCEPLFDQLVKLGWTRIKQ